jgi:aspartyl-tRNA(Asn)/glutamyl-tRNA(Gln) amidotransferase subunit B
MQAIEYEARRQVELVEGGGTVVQETRLFDSGRGVTRSMRSKEHAHDYRYFPDPDLLPLVLDPKWISEIKVSMPELPDAKKQRFIRDFKLSEKDAGILVAEKENAAFFDEVAKGRKDPKLAANWVVGELFGMLNREGKDITQSPVSAKSLAGLLDLIENNTISGRIAKDVFALMVETGKDAALIVEEKGLKQVTDTGAIEGAIDKVIADNAAKVSDYRSGKQAIFGWFVGQVMKATQGKANPALVNELLKKKLAG